MTRPLCHNSLRWLLVFILSLASGLGVGCRTPRARAAAAVPAIVVAVPRVARPPVLEKHDHDALWRHSAGSGPFPDPDGHGPARPYSNARFLWDDTALYLSLYAADQDIGAPDKRHDGPLWLHDAFTVRLRTRPDGPIFVIDIAPSGVVSDLRRDGARLDASWESATRVSVDIDGTLDDPTGEDDEEWVVFAAVPWASLAVRPAIGQRVWIQIGRCDRPKQDRRRCATWGAGGAPVAVLQLKTR